MLVKSPRCSLLPSANSYYSRKRVNKTMRNSIKSLVSNFISDDRGQDMVEYSLVMVLIGTVALIFVTGLGMSVTGIFSTVSQKLEAVSSAIT